MDLLKKKKKPKKPFNLEKALGDGSSTSEKKTEANVADETAVRDAPDDDDGDKIDFGKKKKKGTGAKKVLDEDTENKGKLSFSSLIVIQVRKQLQTSILE